MAVGALLVVAVRPPVRLTGLQAVHGQRVLPGVPRAAEEVLLRWDERALRAQRRADGWQVDGATAAPATADALEDLLATLARLRAVDAFTPRDGDAYGLTSPRGAIELRRGTRVRRLVLGGTNAAGSALYARRDGERRVLQLGIGLVSTIERVFYSRDSQRPESG